MQNIFNTVALSRPATNRFDLKHDVKLSFRMGYLVPTFLSDVLPGDVFTISPTTLLRFAPLIAPIMHRVNVTTHFYFVPNRILWSGWEEWITNNEDGGVPAPFVQLEGQTVGGLGDYLGIPAGFTWGAGANVSAFPVAAYYKIWDEYYRDQNLQAEQFIDLIPGDNSLTYASRYQDPPLRRAWMHDYFTSALPFAQKGSSVQIPLTFEQDIPVDYTNAQDHPGIWKAADGSPVSLGVGLVEASGPSPFADSASIDDKPVAYDPNGTLTVDVQSQATDINTLRLAFRLQEFLERDARGGTRYTEKILAHFAVKSSDARLQRPEYIGGSRQVMSISEVLATAQSANDETAEVPVGNMAGHGISVGGGQPFRYRAEEHGWIIGLINVQPVTAYQQGIPRMFSRADQLDFAWPSFANIGEQPVYVRELYMGGTEPDAVFGYVPRYAEYKYMNSRVAGEFRTTLDVWHLSRIFNSTPALNAEFIEARPDTRIFAVTDENEDHIFGQIINDVKVTRRLPRYGIPTL